MQITNSKNQQLQNNFILTNEDLKKAKNRALNMSIGVNSALLTLGTMNHIYNTKNEIKEELKKKPAMTKKIENEISSKIKNKKTKEFLIGATLLGIISFFEYKIFLLDNLLKNKIKKED